MSLQPDTAKPAEADALSAAEIASAVQALTAAADKAYADMTGFGRFFSDSPRVTVEQIKGLTSPKMKPEELGEKLASLCESGVVEAIYSDGGRYSARYVSGYRITELGCDCLLEAAHWNVDHKKQDDKSESSSQK